MPDRLFKTPLCLPLGEPLVGALARMTEAIGSAFVLNVNSRAEAKKFSDGDPFTQNGVFKTIIITRMRKGQWNPGVAEGA